MLDADGGARPVVAIVHDFGGGTHILEEWDEHSPNESGTVVMDTPCSGATTTLTTAPRSSTL
jgi:hypothetical protein